MGLFFFYMAHERLIAEQPVSYMPENLFLPLKYKILHMEHTDLIPIIGKCLVNHPSLRLGTHLIRVNQVHRIQNHLHVGGMDVLQKPLHPGRAVQRVVEYALHAHNHSQLFRRVHNLPHAL